MPTIPLLHGGECMCADLETLASIPSGLLKRQRGGDSRVMNKGACAAKTIDKINDISLA